MADKHRYNVTCKNTDTDGAIQDDRQTDTDGVVQTDKHTYTYRENITGRQSDTDGETKDEMQIITNRYTDKQIMTKRHTERYSQNGVTTPTTSYCTWIKKLGYFIPDVNIFLLDKTPQPFIIFTVWKRW